MYRLEHDPSTKVFHITAEGFWDLPTAAAFGGDGRGAGECDPAPLRQFRHRRRCAPLSDPIGPVTEALRLLLPKARLPTNGPIALIAAGMLNKLQIDRLFSGERVRSFLDYDQAMAWIDAEWIAKRAVA